MDKEAWQFTDHRSQRDGHDRVTMTFTYIYAIYKYLYLCICIYTHTQISALNNKIFSFTHTRLTAGQQGWIYSMKSLMDPGPKRSDHDSHSSKEKYLQVLSQAVKCVGIKRHFPWPTPTGRKGPHGPPICKMETERQGYLQNSSSQILQIETNLCVSVFFFLGCLSPQGTLLLD